MFLKSMFQVNNSNHSSLPYMSSSQELLIAACFSLFQADILDLDMVRTEEEADS
jgi:hypothetical protein